MDTLLGVSACYRPRAEARKCTLTLRFVADIVDPHGVHLADALPKLRGLATYAAKPEQMYRRIEAIAEVGGRLRVLDMTRKDVRAAVEAAENANDLYASVIGGDYL